MPDPTESPTDSIDELTQVAVESISNAIHSKEGLLVMPSTLDGKDTWSLGCSDPSGGPDVYVLAVIVNDDLLGRLSPREDFVLQYSCRAEQ